MGSVIHDKVGIICQNLSGKMCNGPLSEKKYRNSSWNLSDSILLTRISANKVVSMSQISLFLDYKYISDAQITDLEKTFSPADIKRSKPFPTKL